MYNSYCMSLCSSVFRKCHTHSIHAHGLFSYPPSLLANRSGGCAGLSPRLSREGHAGGKVQLKKSISLGAQSCPLSL